MNAQAFPKCESFQSKISHWVSEFRRTTLLPQRACCLSLANRPASTAERFGVRVSLPVKHFLAQRAPHAVYFQEVPLRKVFPAPLAVQYATMKGDLDTDDEQVPSYEESIASNNVLGATSRHGSNDTTGNTKAPRQPLQTNLASTRSYRVQSTLTAYIEPLLDSQGLDGITRSTFILIPSDTLSNLSNLKPTDLVALPRSTHNVTIVRLHSPDNQASFWEQSAVVQQLVSDLSTRLASSGYRTEEAQLPPRPDAATQRPGQIAGGRSSWLKRSFNAGQGSDPTASMSHWKLGWRSEDEDANKKLLERDEMRVNAKVKDISVMRESDLGLLLTETVKAVWLEVELGS